MSTDSQGEFTVLFSHASSMVYADLVAPDRFTSRSEADEYGKYILRAQAGLQYEVMEKISGEWRSTLNELAVDVIRRRWA